MAKLVKALIEHTAYRSRICLTCTKSYLENSITPMYINSSLAFVLLRRDDPRKKKSVYGDLSIDIVSITIRPSQTSTSARYVSSAPLLRNQPCRDAARIFRIVVQSSTEALDLIRKSYMYISLPISLLGTYRPHSLSKQNRQPYLL